MAKTFRDLIAANKRNSVLLVVIFILFVAAVALGLSLAILAYWDPEAAAELNWGRSLLVGGVAAGVSFLISLGAYFAGANMVLALSGAKEISHRDDPQLFNIVEEMSIAAGVPMPKVYIIEDSAPNAFATGRNPQHSAVAVTRGLREKLNRQELQGVIAHEMAHIRNFDIRLMLLMAVLIGTIAMMSDLFLQMLRISSRRSRSSSGGKKGGGGVLVLIFLVLGVFLAIIAPILARLIQLAVSREREYLADASAVALTRNPVGLAEALRKIDADPEVLEKANRGTAHLFIANPIKKFEDRAQANSVFASHPPIKERIRRLLALVRESDTSGTKPNS